MSTTSEVYVLVTLSNATLTSSPTSNGPRTFTDKLALECITLNIPRTRMTTTPATPKRDVLLVLRLGAFEAPLDPARSLTVSVLPPSGARRYVFHATQDDAQFTVDLPPVTPETAEAVELFHSVLVGYTADAHGLGDAPARGADHNASALAEGARLEEDLRGRFVLVNEDNGEVVGALDRSVRVNEDPSLGEKGHEKDPVVVELSEDADTLTDSEVLVRAIPPEERDWLVKGAVFVSYAISGTTTLLTSAMTSASNYYIAHTTPGAPSPTPPSSSSASLAHDSESGSSRTLLLLQSPTTRKHLTSIHAVSGSAVNLSNKAAAAVESWIERASGRGTTTDKDKGKGKPQSTLSPPQPLGAASDRKSPPPPLPSRSRSRSPAAYPPATKPPLPARNNKSSLSPSPSRTPSPSPSQQSTSTTPLSTRVALSASLILSSLAESSVRLVDAGGAAVTAAVAHSYGTAAGENVALAAGTMRNVVLVYVDVRGMGRRAIVKRTAKTWAKGRVAKSREGAAPQK